MKRVQVALVSIILLVFPVIALAPAPKTDRPNIILISIDTLRADYFTPKRMPLTYAWAKKNAIIYTNAFSNATWTGPAHASLFTGRLPHEHGLEKGFDSISNDIPVLAEELVKEGYCTAGWSNGGWLDRKYGFARGFSVWGHILESGACAEYPWKYCLTWLDIRAPQDKPLFIFLHTFYVHNYGAYWDVEMPNAERAHLYAKRVASFDRIFFDALSKLLVHPKLNGRPLMVVITSDHGEGLGERMDIAGPGGYVERVGRYESVIHGNLPFAAVSRIPLVVYSSAHQVGINNSLVDLISVHTALRDHAFAIPARDKVVTEFFATELNSTWSASISAQQIRPGTAKVSPETVRELKALGYIR